MRAQGTLTDATLTDVTLTGATLTGVTLARTALTVLAKPACCRSGSYRADTTLLAATRAQQPHSL